VVWVLQHSNEFRKNTISPVQLPGMLLLEGRLIWKQELYERLLMRTTYLYTSLAMFSPSEEAIDSDQPTYYEQKKRNK
jgi:hypothetical protein